MTGPLALRSPTRRWHRVWFATACGCAATALLLVLWRPVMWTLLPLALLGVAQAVQVWVLMHTSVELRPAGLVVHHAGLRRRRVSWDEVTGLRVDPLGGPRLVRCALRSGREVVLPELGSEDVARVVDAHAAARRGAAPPG